MSPKKVNPDGAMISKVENGPPSCPHCNASITNYMNIFYNRKYQCTQCKEKYFMIKVASLAYTLFNL